MQEALFSALGFRPREVKASQTRVSHTHNETITSSDTETGPNNSTANGVVAVANELNSQKSPAENDVNNLSTKNVGNNAGQFSSSDVLQSVSTSANIADSGTRTENSEMTETTTITTTTTTKKANKTTITTTTTTITTINNNNNNNNNNNTATEQDNQPLLAPTEGPTGKVPVTMKEKRDFLRKNKQTEAVADLQKRQQAKKTKKAKKAKKGKKAKKAATSSASAKGVNTPAKRRSARLRTVAAPLAELSAQSSVNKPKSTKSSVKVRRPSASTSPSTAATTPSASIRTRSQVSNNEAPPPPPPPPTFQLAAPVNETPSEMVVRSKKKQQQLNYYCLWPGCAHWSDYQWNIGAHLRSVHLILPKTKFAAEKKVGVNQLKTLMNKWMRTDVPEKEKGKKN